MLNSGTQVVRLGGSHFHTHTEPSCQPPKKSGFEKVGCGHMPVITAVRSLRQEDHHKFEASLGYAMSLSLSPSPTLLSPFPQFPHTNKIKNSLIVLTTPCCGFFTWGQYSKGRLTAVLSSSHVCVISFSGGFLHLI